MDGRKTVAGQSVISGGNASEVFQLAKHAFDGIASPVEIWRKAVFSLAVGLWRDVGNAPQRFYLMTYGIAVVSPVAMHHQVCWRDIKQIGCGCAVSNLSAGEHQSQRTAKVIAQGMDLGDASTTRAANCLAGFPFFPPLAQRWALTAELSISTSEGGPPAAARAWKMFAQMPFAPTGHSDCTGFSWDHSLMAHQPSGHLSSAHARCR